jgi:hypothetical protein
MCVIPALRRLRQEDLQFVAHPRVEGKTLSQKENKRKTETGGREGHLFILPTVGKCQAGGKRTLGRVKMEAKRQAFW